MGSKLAVNGGEKLMSGKKFPAWPQYGQAEADVLLRVLNSGIWGINGKETGNFERAFAAYQHCNHCVSMVNGSATLRNALIACGLEEGSEVIVPPYTFLATATAVIEANCVPVFADIDPDTYCIDPKSVEVSITKNTKAIIPVHLGGHPAQMDKIMEIAKRHNLYVIEDSAHAHGSEFAGKRVGSLGHIGSFSFQSSKNLCSGEGGAIVTNDERLAEKCWSLANCGRAKNGAWYEHETLGGNYRLSQFQAAILNEQLKKLDAELEKREANAAYLDKRLAEIPGIKPQARSKEVTRRAYHLYVFRYEKERYNGVSRAAFIEALSSEGLPTSPGYTTLIYKQPFFRKNNFGPFAGWKHSNPNLNYNETVCKVAERAAAEEACWLGQNLLLGEKKDMDDIANTIFKVYENRDDLEK